MNNPAYLVAAGLLLVATYTVSQSTGVSSLQLEETSCGKAAIYDVITWAKKQFQDDKEVRQQLIATYTPAANSTLTVVAKLESTSQKPGVEEIQEVLWISFEENGINRSYNFQQKHPVFTQNQTILTERRGNDTPRSCEDVQNAGNSANGVYLIFPYTGHLKRLGVEAYCDLVTDGGGWTVIQRREPPGKENFERNWFDYEKGFGDPNGSYWLGLSAISALTVPGDSSIRIDLMSFRNESRLAEYRYFRVENQTTNYRLNIGDYSGNAGDAMATHNRMPFSTPERDNGAGAREYDFKASHYKGGWWYTRGWDANLNGFYTDMTKATPPKYVSIAWLQWLGYDYSLKFVEMKVRSRSFKKK